MKQESLESKRTIRNFRIVEKEKAAITHGLLKSLVGHNLRALAANSMVVSYIPLHNSFQSLASWAFQIRHKYKQ